MEILILQGYVMTGQKTMGTSVSEKIPSRYKEINESPWEQAVQQSNGISLAGNIEVSAQQG